MAIFIYFFLFLFIYKKCSNFIERFACIIFTIAFFTPFFLFVLDRFNLPSFFFSGVDTSRWFNFISSYLSTIIGAIIGFTATFMVLYFQIKSQKLENDEERRIHNLPLFVYDFFESIPYNLTSVYKDVYINYETKNMNNLYLKVENIGLNHSKRVFYIVEVDNIRYSSYFGMSPSILKVGCCFGLNLIFGLGSGSYKDFKISIKILYKDLLENCYSQNIILICSNKSSNNEQKDMIITSYSVDDAIVISEDEWNNFTNTTK